VRIEEVVGRRMAEHRTELGMSQAELGERLGVLLGRSWPRQSVWAAEKGQRAFTAAELLALVEVLRLPGVDELFVAPWDVDGVELGGATVDHPATSLPRAGGNTRADAVRSNLHLVKEQVAALTANAEWAQKVHARQTETLAALQDAVSIAIRLSAPEDHSPELQQEGAQHDADDQAGPGR
jgi:transcriptional regulator with XRE-family HTH domain